MLNQVVLVGRIYTPIELLPNGDCTTLLKVTKGKKNPNGDYDSDYINIVLKGSIAQNMNDYCKEGDLVGIKGQLHRAEYDFYTTVEVEKVTFLSETKGGD